MYFDLTGQTAIVTGAATGIGEAIARRLARAGAAVAVADLNFDGATEAAQSIGGMAFPVHIDITLSDSVNAAVAEVLSRTGRIDILVNNAGITGASKPLWDLSYDIWARVLDINLNGVFRCCKAVIGHMRENAHGAIVNVASIAGKEGNPNLIPYSVSKAGVIALTKALAKETATQGIRVNAVAPAVIETDILRQMTPETVQYMLSKIPMERFGTLEEVAAVVHFLASDDASFVTGQTYDVSGGRATY